MRFIGGKGNVVSITLYSRWHPSSLVVSFVGARLIIILFGRHGIHLHLVPVLDQILHLHVLSHSSLKLIEVRCWFFA